jgi:putative tricarboxylic transport membrane protein
LKKLDIIAALTLLVLSAVVFFETWDLPYWDRFTPGPSFASLWVAGAGALIGTLLLVQALATRVGEPADWPAGIGMQRVLLSTAASWLLLIMLPWLGTALSGVIFMLLFLIGIARCRVIPSLATTVITIGLVELVFSFWLRIDLPSGIVGF